MEYLVIGLAVLFNIVVIKIKFEKGRIADAALDAIVLAGITVVFSGGYGTLVIGTIASAGFSIFLMFSPPDIQKLLTKLPKAPKKGRGRRRH